LILRDPVHGLIAFESAEDDLLLELLETAEVQRLRRIRALGVTSLAFPGAEHTRFAHALGTAHVMKRLIGRLRDVEHELKPEHRITPHVARVATAAALLHDLGHGPLSHLFEETIAGATPHEQYSSAIILDPETSVGRVLARRGPSLANEIAELVHGRHALPYLARAVSGTVDVDRCDYLLRDAHATGVPYGRYDLDWLLRALRFAPAKSSANAPPLAIDGAKGIVSIESFVLARHFMFQQVYFHKASRAAEWMIRCILSRVASLVADGRPPPSLPRAIETAVRGKPVKLADYLELDDAVLYTSMHAWEDAPDPILRDLTRRLRARALFKTLELYGTEPEQRARALAIAAEIATRSGLDPTYYVGLDVAADTPFPEPGDPLEVIFPRGTPRAPSDVSFLLRRLEGETVTRVRLVCACELRDAIVAAIRP
jgi:uncharacterized protein